MSEDQEYNSEYQMLDDICGHKYDQSHAFSLTETLYDMQHTAVLTMEYEAGERYGTVTRDLNINTLTTGVMGPFDTFIWVTEVDERDYAWLCGSEDIIASDGQQFDPIRVLVEDFGYELEKDPEDILNYEPETKNK